MLTPAMFLITVYAAQPREGTETLASVMVARTASSLVYAAQPREGTETICYSRRTRPPCRPVYAAQPREGTETSLCR